MNHGSQGDFNAVNKAALREQLSALAGEYIEHPDAFCDAVMGILENAGVVEQEAKLHLLSPHGLLLCEMARTPDATLRQLGMRLGWSEAWVHKAATRLVRAGFASRTRVGQRVTYKFDRTEILTHPDTGRLASLFARIAGNTHRVEH